jgi:hypothetical protein
MSITSTVRPPPVPVLHSERVRALQIIARSLFRELSAQGYTPHHVITLSSELIQVVTDVMKGSHPEPLPATVPVEASLDTAR